MDWNQGMKPNPGSQQRINRAVNLRGVDKEGGKGEGDNTSNNERWVS